MAGQSTGYYFNDPVQKCSQLRRNLSWGMLATVVDQCWAGITNPAGHQPSIRV